MTPVQITVLMTSFIQFLAPKGFCRVALAETSSYLINIDIAGIRVKISAI